MFGFNDTAVSECLKRKTAENCGRLLSFRLFEAEQLQLFYENFGVNWGTAVESQIFSEKLFQSLIVNCRDLVTFE